jgi:Tfp pilus assembly protein PilV
MKKTSVAGVTFVELLITIFVFTGAILGALMFFVNAMIASQYAKDITVVTSHAEYLMEEMESRSTLTNITATNWSSWYSSQALATLPSEAITVTFTNATADPLNISVNVSWLTKRRSLNQTFATRMTK